MRMMTMVITILMQSRDIFLMLMTMMIQIVMELPISMDHMKCIITQIILRQKVRVA